MVCLSAIHYNNCNVLLIGTPLIQTLSFIIIIVINPWFNQNKYGTRCRYMYNRLLLSLAFLSAWTKLYIFTGLDILQEKRNAGTADLIMSDL